MTLSSINLPKQSGLGREKDKIGNIFLNPIPILKSLPQIISQKEEIDFYPSTMIYKREKVK